MTCEIYFSDRHQKCGHKATYLRCTGVTDPIAHCTKHFLQYWLYYKEIAVEYPFINFEVSWKRV